MKLVPFICFLLALISSISAFCVYNQLTDGTYIQVKQTRREIPEANVFSVKISQGDKQCCHFSNKDCSPNGNDDDPAFFTVNFIQDLINRSTFNRVECTTGGGLTIYNDGEERVASCTHADGTSVNTLLLPLY